MSTHSLNSEWNCYLCINISLAKHIDESCMQRRKFRVKVITCVQLSQDACTFRKCVQLSKDACTFRKFHAHFKSYVQKVESCM